MINLFFGLAVFVGAILIIIAIIRDHRWNKQIEIRHMKYMEDKKK